jgi:hypothetical protein
VSLLRNVSNFMTYIWTLETLPGEIMRWSLSSPNWSLRGDGHPDTRKVGFVFRLGKQGVYVANWPITHQLFLRSGNISCRSSRDTTNATGTLPLW